MKDMERWAKIQNRQKESVRAASPVLKGGLDDDRRQSKSADAGFAIFERKVRDPPLLFTMNIDFSTHLFIIFCNYFCPVFVYNLRSQERMIFLRSPLLLLRKMKSQK